MQERWHDSEFTADWDRGMADAYPSRALQVSLLVSLMKHLYQPGKCIIDLGFGSGRVEEQLFLSRPDARVVGVDSSAAMIDLARQRLARWTAQYSIVQHDLAAMDTVQLPAEIYQIAVSVQVLHHLPQQAQRSLHRWTYNILEPDGWYLIVDKRALAEEDLEAYAVAWDALEQDPNWRTGRSFADHLKRERDRGHAPATMEQLLQWLAEANFHATCMQAHLDRLLVVARRK